MIGFTLDAKVYDEDGDVEYVTVLIRLDQDAMDDPEHEDRKLLLDVRVAGQGWIANLNIEDAWEAIRHAKMLHDSWESAQP